ncbi:hypothetical protein GW916_08060 [bacterium]|nr:hypothetical protein [bacterium]
MKISPLSIALAFSMSFVSSQVAVAETELDRTCGTLVTINVFPNDIPPETDAHVQLVIRTSELSRFYAYVKRSKYTSGLKEDLLKSFDQHACFLISESNGRFWFVEQVE